MQEYRPVERSTNTLPKENKKAKRKISLLREKARRLHHHQRLGVLHKRTREIMRNLLDRRNVMLSDHVILGLIHIFVCDA